MRTCRECKYLGEQNYFQPKWYKCNYAPVPIWAAGHNLITDESCADNCPTFSPREEERHEQK